MIVRVPLLGSRSVNLRTRLDVSSKQHSEWHVRATGAYRQQEWHDASMHVLESMMVDPTFRSLSVAELDGRAGEGGEKEGREGTQRERNHRERNQGRQTRCGIMTKRSYLMAEGGSCSPTMSALMYRDVYCTGISQSMSAIYRCTAHRHTASQPKSPAS